MQRGWVKLWRRIEDHPIMRDSVALHLFIWLLVRVDKNTGKYKTGRYVLGESLNLNPNTIKSALQRLYKKYHLIDKSGTNKYTEISVLKWAKFQPEYIPTPQTTPQTTPAKHQQNTTKQDTKNKDIYILSFNKFYKTNYRKTPARERKIKERLKTYTIDQILGALENMSSIPFYKGNNDRKWKPTPDYLIRNDETVDNMLNNKTDKFGLMNI